MATKTLQSKIVSTEVTKTVSGQSEKTVKITVQTDYDGTMIVQVYLRTSIFKKKVLIFC